MTVPTRVKQSAEKRSFFVGDSIVIEFWCSIDGTPTDSASGVQVESPIVSITWDAEQAQTVIVGGTLTELTLVNNDTGHYGAIFVPTDPGWHRYIIYGGDFVRNGSFYVQATTLAGA